jgi:hypothetical protein
MISKLISCHRKNEITQIGAMQHRVYFCDAQGHLVLASKLLVLPLVLSRPKTSLSITNILHFLS